MATGDSLGLNPLVCGMAAVVVGDSAVYYGAGGTSAVFVFQRANIANPEIFRFGMAMTVLVIAILLLGSGSVLEPGGLSAGALTADP